MKEMISEFLNNNLWPAIFSAVVSIIITAMLTTSQRFQKWLKDVRTRRRLEKKYQQTKSDYKNEIVAFEVVTPCYENGYSKNGERHCNATMEMTDKAFILKMPENLKQKISSYLHSDKKHVFAVHEPIDNGGFLKELSEFLRKYYGFHFKTPKQINAFLLERTKFTVNYFIDRLEHSKLAFNNEQVGIDRIITNRTDNDDKSEKPTLLLKLYRTDYFTAQVMVHVYQELRRLDEQQAEIDPNYISIFDKISVVEQLNSEFRPFMSSLGIGGYLLFNRTSNIEYWTVLRTAAVRNGSENNLEMRSYSFDETIDLRDGEWDIYGTFFPDIYKAAERALQEELGLFKRDKRIKMGACKVNSFILIRTNNLGDHSKDRFEMQLLGYSFVKLNEDFSYDELVLSKKCAQDGHYEALKVYPNPVDKPLIAQTDTYTHTPESVFYADILRYLYNNNALICEDSKQS